MNIIKSSLQVPCNPLVSYKVTVYLEYYLTNVFIKSSANAHLIQYVHCMHKTFCEGCAGQATLCYKGITRCMIPMGSARHSYYHLVTKLLPCVRIFQESLESASLCLASIKRHNGRCLFLSPFWQSFPQ